MRYTLSSRSFFNVYAWTEAVIFYFVSLSADLNCKKCNINVAYKVCFGARVIKRPQVSVEPAATPCPACPLPSGIFNYDRCAHILYVAHVFFALMLFHTSFAAKAK